MCIGQKVLLMGSGEHILVVDDDAGMRGILTRVFKQAGYVVATATNGEEALAAIAQNPPAVLVLDLMMPVMDGWEVYRKLREEHQVRLPIVVLSAGANLERAAQDFPDATVMAKPFDIDTLLAAVKEQRSY
jgi:DNA-binding response OmpR family regulator